MIRVRATVGLGAALVLAIFGWGPHAPADHSGDENNDRPVTVTPGRDGPAARVLGSASCSGIACHGGKLPGHESLPRSAWVTNEPDPDRWMYSESLFRSYDPHTRAYAVLLAPRSIEICKRLAGFAEPHNEPRCLVCHSTPILANQRDHPAHKEGVSCEACHGSGAHWIADHAGWTAGTGHAAELVKTGMTNLSDPATRAEVCVGCHVGAPATDAIPARDVNHDLIAAGHPRLNFDYATYLRSLPPHWAERDRSVNPPKLRPPGEEVTHWLVGRAVGTAAGLELLASRASRPKAWPELAEFDCYACHHDLPGAPSNHLGRRQGALVWNAPPLADALGGPSLQALRSAVERPGDSAAIAERAADAATNWRAWRREASSMPRRVVAERLARTNPRRWDEACHLYYGLLAIDRAADPTRSQPLDPRLVEVRSALRLPIRDGRSNCFSPRVPDLAGRQFESLFWEGAR